ncbi:MAG: hypothetical protein A2898_03985 [Candidatus Kerfeldbacteria bacterium RIFCSPLOWO2_01_FULL_48_11]|uniref:DUF2341 domain-containing protein n=1 Tax=Candidatus Kerfeldbacteria bacterium RIFCSPLOWO2_01_FULL_48_11 TaxID=1798543 RepID=A0A1G2B6M2_9BACT|nr:MAG: hypothetical protein A2898_03985 [Candidatus Kerfeldbacteria bacterium RIFCSPLOWO2_01_FULL_48_11]
MNTTKYRIRNLTILTAISVFVIAGGTALAQWQNPSSATPATPGDPNVDNPLYSGSDALYGGKAQARIGALTIGSVTSLGSETLYISGKTLIADQLRVGTGDFSTGHAAQSAIAAFSGAGHGVFGATADASKYGVVGTTTIAGGTGVSGSAAGASDGVGVYGVAGGNGSIAIVGVNVGEGNAGNFLGRTKVAGIAGGSAGTLDASHGGYFNGDMSVLGAQVSTQFLTLAGNPFDPRTVNARSVQDAASASPVGDPGVRTFVLKSSGLPCKVGGVACTGAVPAGSTAEWNIGPSGTGFFTDKKVVETYLAQYSVDGRVFYSFMPVVVTDIKYEECNGSGKTPLGKFSVLNSLGTPAQFRLIIMYKEFATAQTCDPFSNFKQLSVDPVYQGDSVQVRLTSSTTPTAAALFALQPNPDEVRILWKGAEIDRHVVTYDANTIEIWFRAQEDSAAADATNYLLWYQGAAGPPPANLDNVYLLRDDFESGFNAVKWGTSTFKKGGIYCTNPADGASVLVQSGELVLQHNHLTSCYSGASAFSQTPLQKVGKYTMTFDFKPDTRYNASNDGVYLRNPTVVRETTWYNEPNELSVYIGLGPTCDNFTGSISAYSYGSRPVATYFCPWANAITNRIGTFPQAFTNGTNYPVKIELDADYINGGNPAIKGYVRVYQPQSTVRVQGEVKSGNFDTLGPTFVFDMASGWFSLNYTGPNPPAGPGKEKYDNILIRRGRNAYTPVAAVGPDI